MTSSAKQTPQGGKIRQWVVIGVLGAALVAVILLVPRPGSDSGTPDVATTVATSTVAPGPMIDATPADPSEALPVLRSAVDDLLAAAGVQIEARSELDGSIEAFSVSADIAGGAYRSMEIVDADGAEPSRIERVETPDTIFIRVVDEDPDAASRWSVIPIEAEGQRQVYRVYTAFGRITPDLGELMTMLETVQVQVEEIRTGPSGSPGVAEESGYRLTVRTDDVSRYLRDNDLAIMTPSDEVGASVFDMWLDDGRLTRLVATGVQFFTGEPFRNARIEVAYEPAAVTVTAPEVDDSES